MAAVERVTGPVLTLEAAGGAVWESAFKVIVLAITEGLARALVILEAALVDEEMGSVVGGALDDEEMGSVVGCTPL